MNILSLAPTCRRAYVLGGSDSCFLHWLLLENLKQQPGVCVCERERERERQREDMKQCP